MKLFNILSFGIAFFLVVSCAFPAMAAEKKSVAKNHLRLEQTHSFDYSLEYMTYVYTAWELPTNTEELRIFISDSSGNQDLFVKFGSAFISSSSEELEAEADFIATGPSWDESITINASTDPPLEKGRYYAAVINNNNETTTGRINFLATLSDTPLKLYFPHLDTNNPWVTKFNVNNLGDIAIAGVMNLYDDAGVFIADMAVNVPPYGSKMIDVGAEFDITSAGYGVLSYPTGVAAGYTAYSIPGLFKAAIPAVPHNKIAQDKLYAAHIHSDDKWWTGFAFVNTLPESSTIDLNFDDGSTAEVVLPANGHAAMGVRDMFGGSTLPNAKVATITPAQGIIGFELFAWGNQLAGIPLREHGGLSLQFPYLPPNNEWVGLAMYNPNDTTVQLAMHPYATNGESLESINLFPAAGEKKVGMPENLGISPNADWVDVTAAKPVHGFFLLGDIAGNYLTGAANIDCLSTSGTFMDIDLQGTTEFYLANPAENDATVYFQALNSAGQELDEFQTTIPGHGSLITTLQGLFTNPPAGISAVSYSSFNALAAFERLISADGTEAHILPAAVPED